MAHEITATDKLLLNSQGGVAWHGLGRLFTGELTPTEASKEAFPWTVIQKPLFYKNMSGKQRIAEKLMINLRSDSTDDDEPLGVVSENYQVVQPLDMADFAEALVEEDKKVKIETAGSIQGGARIWFLLKGEEFEVAIHDRMVPYILLSNGYDGGSSFRVTPTTVRVVCSNTWHQVLPRLDTGELLTSAISIRHTSNIMSRIEEAKAALANYGKAMEGTKEVIKTLSSKQVDSDAVKKFFLECYTSEIAAIPENPTNGFEERAVKKAQSAFDSFSRRFDDEKSIAGTTMWCAANAFSGLIQHDLKARGADDTDRIEKRVEKNLFGLGQERTQAAFQRAFKVALAQ